MLPNPNIFLPIKFKVRVLIIIFRFFVIINDDRLKVVDLWNPSPYIPQTRCLSLPNLEHCLSFIFIFSLFYKYILLHYN